MPYTFEIIFSGLVFFTFSGGSYPDYDQMNANLVRTKGGQYSTCEETVRLPQHLPRLSVYKDSFKVTFHPNEGAFNCTDAGSHWSCDLTNLELEVQLEGRPASDFKVVPGRVKGAAKEPQRDVPEDAFNWIAHLEWIDGDRVGGLRPEVRRSVDATNDLIAARISSQFGQLASHELIRRLDDKLWEVCPDRQPRPRDHPKVLAETMVLRVEDLPRGSWVRLQKDNDSYIQLEPLTAVETVRVSVHNEMDPDMNPLPAHTEISTCKWRLRHFLWYYELVKWTEGCPPTLSAPVCPGRRCRRWPTTRRRPSRCRSSSSRWA